MLNQQMCTRSRLAPLALGMLAAAGCTTTGTGVGTTPGGRVTAIFAWTAEGPDGHKMSGSISFMVH